MQGTVRCADDIIWYAKMSHEPNFIMEILMEKLGNTGLQTHPRNSKIATTLGVASRVYLDISGSMVEVHMHSSVHIVLSQQHVVRLGHVIQLAWYKL